MLCMNTCLVEYTAIHGGRRGVMGNAALQKFQVSTAHVTIEEIKSDMYGQLFILHNINSYF